MTFDDAAMGYYRFILRCIRMVGTVGHALFGYRLGTAFGQMKALRQFNSSLLLTSVVAAIAASITVVPSNASWQQGEWDSAALGTLDCSADAGFKTRAAGKLLGGSLLPVDLDDVAGVSGMTTTNDGVTAHPDPTNASSVGGDGFVNPLNVSALGLVDVPLTGTTLANLLQINTNNDMGVVNQFATARSGGASLGASGVVNDSGSIMTANNANGSAPTLGTLKLKTLVEGLTGEALSDVVAGVADLELELGAVAGRASLDECDQEWVSDLAQNLERSYAIAGLDLTVDAPAIDQVGDTLTSSIDDIETLLNGLASNPSVISGLTSGLNALIGPLLGGMGSTITLTGPTVTADFTAVRNLANAEIADDGGVVRLDLGDGEVSADLASLLGEAYGGASFTGSGPGLNGLPANTELLINAPVTTALTEALTEALDQWVVDVVDALDDALDLARVQLSILIDLKLGIVPIAKITVPVDATLGSILAGTATVAPTVVLLGSACNPVVPIQPACLLNPIVAALTTGVIPLVGDVLGSVIFADGGVVKTLGATLTAVTDPLVVTLGAIFNDLLGADGLLSLKANIQNDPLSASRPPYPDWEGGAQAVPAGRYDVAALSVGVLDALGASGNVNLELGRGSVGVSCQVGGTKDLAGRCAGY